ncbi:helix-turn-helix transcriptional regulator [Nocardia wallacei]|uniref:helix-turn-helix transcriptional regulator n=1 Tax=Nocardia wallacei TaxID=480035 RepID=UPI0024569386|nr:LuxR family transcriptional regulator [Nocardia wallacei]
MSGSEQPRTLRGRRNECEPLDRLLTEARSGTSRVLVLRGEAGIGKTALLEYLVRNAADCRIARAVGVESQMELAFAGLHQLCAPMMHNLEHLPTPQREALAVAFGLSAGSVPDRFLVGLAVLGLLAEAAEEQPLLCVVDDAQWLDQVSAQTLAFVARRLLAERVALVFAVRTPPVEEGRDLLAGLPELTVRGLRDSDARALLESAIPGRLDDRVIDRIVSEARGNPLALLELPHGPTGAELAGGYGRPDARPVVTRIEQSFLGRIEALSAPARRLLLAAAAEPVGDLTLLRRAAERLGTGADAAAAAERAGLIEFGAQVRFRHPLVRSAAYRAADPGERRAVHRALAEATDPVADPDRRAWHRASATVELDEEVAAELERSATRAQARGGVAAAAAFLRRATGQTPDPATRRTRALAAAQAAFEAGAPDTALELLTAAELGPLDELRRERLARLRAQIVFARRRGGDALPLLLDAAHRMATHSPDQARETYLDAIGSAVFAGRLNGADSVRAVAETARAAVPGTGRRPVDTLLAGLTARFADGYVVGAKPLFDALRAFRGAAADNDDVMRWLWLTWPAAADLWADEAWHELGTRAVQTARETGALNFLPLALTYRAAAHLYAGEFDVAAALVEEADVLTEATGNSPLGYTALLLVAWRGTDPQALRTIESGLRRAATWGEGRTIGTGSQLLAVLHNGQGQYQAALASAEKACEYDDLGSVGHALTELVEAGVRTDAHAAARAALRRLERRAKASGTEWALGMLARSRALLSAGDAAETSYREAVERLSRSRVAVHLARTHLVYGEWLRRENRRADAREQLRIAYEMLHRFGAGAFAERARRELAATGESVRRGAVEVSRVLTAQEIQIARLAGDGLTNSEIGAELFISPRTVEWHLRKVFTKLDLTSRKELRAALDR